MTTIYQGFDLLETAPNAREIPDDVFQRSMAGLDPGLGARWASGRDADPTVARSFLWTCKNRSEIVALKAFLTARRGMAVPFWMPSRRRDLLLAHAVEPTDPGISIQLMGYARFLFPSKARRHLAFRVGLSWVLRSVTAASAGSTTESLTLSSAPGVALPVDTLVGQLLLCRLASDEVGITYLTESVAEARIPYIEIPREAP